MVWVRLRKQHVELKTSNWTDLSAGKSTFQTISPCMLEIAWRLPLPKTRIVLSLSTFVLVCRSETSLTTDSFENPEMHNI
jgi:hypothetical protein